MKISYGSRVYVKRNSDKMLVETSRLAEPKNIWDAAIVGLLPWKIVSQNAGGESTFVLIARPSALLAGVSNGREARLIVTVLLIVGTFFLVVELISLSWSVRLTRTITKSVHDLYQGTLLVAQGDFSHQIPVRGHHQLSDLAKSFNGMTAQIVKLFGEVRKKEKLEAELEIARQRFSTEMNLTDRRTMLFPLLLGRSALAGRFHIDPASSYRCPRPPRTPTPRIHA